MGGKCYLKTTQGLRILDVNIVNKKKKKAKQVYKPCQRNLRWNMKGKMFQVFKISSHIPAFRKIKHTFPL